MNTRNVCIMLVAGALLLPFAVVAPASSQDATAPDLSTATTASRLVYPPYLWQIKTVVCNAGDAASEAAPVFWGARALAGPLNQAPGKERFVGSQTAPALAPGACATLTTTWGGYVGFVSVGEYEFGSTVSAAGDSNSANDGSKVQAAWPAQLAGSGVGGFDR